MPGKRSIIRPGEPTTRRARTVSRRLALGPFRGASPRGSHNHSVGLTNEVALVCPSRIPVPKGIHILDHFPRAPPRFPREAPYHQEATVGTK